MQELKRPDILLLEGLNIGHGAFSFIAKDFFIPAHLVDFVLYLDASIENIKSWYLSRFLMLRQKARKQEKSFFYRYVTMPEGQALKIAEKLWDDINFVNFKENIFPLRFAADLILYKDKAHKITDLALRHY